MIATSMENNTTVRVDTRCIAYLIEDAMTRTYIRKDREGQTLCQQCADDVHMVRV